MEFKDYNVELTFEQAMNKLEELINRLENEELPMEESLKYFQEGMRLSRLCQDKLKEIEYKVEVIIKENELDAPALNGED